MFGVAPPDDDEANYRRPNPNDLPNDIPVELEESLSIHEPAPQSAEFKPPPPSGPIPHDILQEYQADRQRAASEMLHDKKQDEPMVYSPHGNHLGFNKKPEDRRATFHGMKAMSKQVELQQYKPRLSQIKGIYIFIYIYSVLNG